jgi:hypothetical protein
MRRTRHETLIVIGYQSALAIKRQPRILRTPVCAAMSVSQAITHQRIESRFGTASAVLPGRFRQETIDA